ncbi:hypothetical protein JZ751_029162 [Albula glossodonta]|uniref:Uncharacterized protein n=1 Tax=Albula glossodonta TaxID=121402 RepID=A0A8T2P8H8_9TELE|nr:hypothetical protein JZ751_029162 [Albula glossodonta]
MLCCDTSMPPPYRTQIPPLTPPKLCPSPLTLTPFHPSSTTPLHLGFSAGQAVVARVTVVTGWARLCSWTLAAFLCSHSVTSAAAQRVTCSEVSSATTERSNASTWPSSTPAVSGSITTSTSSTGFTISMIFSLGSSPLIKNFVFSPVFKSVLSWVWLPALMSLSSTGTHVQPTAIET